MRKIFKTIFSELLKRAQGNRIAMPPKETAAITAKAKKEEKPCLTALNLSCPVS